MKRTTLLPVAGCALSLLLALATAGCGGSPHAAPTTTATTQPSTTTSSATTSAASSTTSTSIDVSVIPPQITVPYVNAVFAALNHKYGDVIRSEIATRTLAPSSVAVLRALYTDPIYDTQLRIASDVLSSDLRNVRTPPGDRLTTVRTLISSNDRCIFALTSTDYSQVLVTPGPEATAEYYQLVPKIASDDAEHLNPTAWMVKGNAAYQSASFVAPTNPC